MSELLIKKITIKEALEQGYTQCGYKGVDYQNLMDIATLINEDFHKTILVAKPEAHSVSISSCEIIEYLCDRYSEESPDDDNFDIELCLKEKKELIEKFVSDMNEVYSKKQWWYLSNTIELIP